MASSRKEVHPDIQELQEDLGYLELAYENNLDPPTPPDDVYVFGEGSHLIPYRNPRRGVHPASALESVDNAPADAQDAQVNPAVQVNVPAQVNAAVVVPAQVNAAAQEVVPAQVNAAVQVNAPEPPNQQYEGQAVSRLNPTVLRNQPSSSTTTGTFRCSAKQCPMCKHVLNLSAIEGPIGSYQITGKFNCNSNNVVYAITCHRCDKIYLGETKTRVRDRLLGHLNKFSQVNTVLRHHFTNVHTTNDLRISVIAQASADDFERKHLEQSIVVEIGSNFPFGLNMDQVFTNNVLM